MKYWHPHLPFGQHLLCNKIKNKKRNPINIQNNWNVISYSTTFKIYFFFQIFNMGVNNLKNIWHRSWRGVLDTTLCDKVCRWLATGRWFSPGTPVSSTNKTDRHDITEILLKVALKHHKLNKPVKNIWFKNARDYFWKIVLQFLKQEQL